MLSFKKFLQEHLLSETEFTGLNNRKKGDPFITDGTPTSGDPLEFVEVKFFPSIDKYPGNIKQVTIVNKTNASLPAFAVATFLNKTTKKEIKFFSVDLESIGAIPKIITKKFKMMILHNRPSSSKAKTFIF